MALLTAPALHRSLISDDGIIYPESDGKPMADSTEQAEWMTLIHSNFAAWYKHDPHVFVAIDLLWYPLKGKPKITIAPDVMVAFGRPQGPRRSYLQWQEANIAPQVVFEIVSDSNGPGELMYKSAFYQTYGVEECYLYEPDMGGLEVILFAPEGLQHIAVAHEWTSPRLGMRFVPQPRAPMEMFLPNGEPFRTLKEQQDLTRLEAERADAERKRAEREAERAETERERANSERKRAEVERERAESERERANAQAERAEAESLRADAERERAERLQAKLREMGIDPNAL